VTLILGVYSNWHAIQVSDRMVSLAGRQPVPYDTLANKTIVYFGRRGIVTIGYTGPAYIKGVPTDKWVAQTLSGLDLSTSGTAFGVRICRSFDIGQAIEHLRCEATKIVGKPGARLLEFHIIGSQWDRKHLRLRPVICKVTNKRTGGTTFEKLSVPRNWPIHRGYYFLLAGSGTDEARNHMRKQFQLSGGPQSPEHCIDVMIEAIRHISGRIPSIVGPDCMAVHIQGGSPKVSIYFKPQFEYKVRHNSNGPWNGPLAFSPYLISPNMVSQPSISTNNMFLSTPDVDVRFEGGPQLPIDQMPAMQSHQRRPAPPS
jgi:hypothetical protein